MKFFPNDRRRHVGEEVLKWPLLAALSSSGTCISGLVCCSGGSGIPVQGYAICKGSEEEVYDGKVRK